MSTVPDHDEEFEEPPNDLLSIGSLSKGPVFASTLEETMVEDFSDSLEAQKVPRCTPEVKTLAVSAALFSFITSLQIYAALVAHSRALLMDCISSAVDAFTFMGNIVVECKKRDGRRHAVSQLVIVAASLGLLCFFTLRAMGESIQSVKLCLGEEHKDEDPEEVNGWITLGFGLGNMLFDFICLFNFYKTHKQTGSGKHANMFSALLHVGADFLRASCTLVLSLLILIATWDSTCLDAVCSLVIGVTILSGVAVGFYKWLRLLLSLC